MKPELNKTYKVLFTNYPEYYSDCDEQEKYTVRYLMYIGKNKRGKYLFLDEENKTVSILPKNFRNMVFDKNNETLPTKNVSKSKEIEKQEKHSFNMKQNYCRFVSLDIPHRYKTSKPIVYDSYIALQIKDTLYYVKDKVVLHISASNNGLLIDPFDDDIPIQAPQQLIDLYKIQKAKS